MADRITTEERRLIDAHLARHGAQVIPQGVCAEDPDAIANGLRLRDARDRAICAEAEDRSLAELSSRFRLSASMVKRILLQGDAWAKDQQRRLRCRL
jgi:hypothetical protein